MSVDGATFFDTENDRSRESASEQIRQQLEVAVVKIQGRIFLWLFESDFCCCFFNLYHLFTCWDELLGKCSKTVHFSGFSSHETRPEFSARAPPSGTHSLSRSPAANDLLQKLLDSVPRCSHGSLWEEFGLQDRMIFPVHRQHLQPK